MRFRRERKTIDLVIENLLPEQAYEHAISYDPVLRKMGKRAQRYYWKIMERKYGVGHYET